MADVDPSWLLDEILRARLHAVIGVLVLWTLIGALVGLILSGLVSWLLSRLGAFRLAWKHAIWLKIAAIVWIVGACSLLGCSIGLIEGAFRGARIVVRDSSFRTDVLDPVGRECAAGIAAMDCYLEQARQKENPDDRLELSPEQEAFVARFREGKEELNVEAFLGRVENLEATFAEEVVREILARLQDRNEIEKGGLCESILRQFLPRVIRWGIRRKAKNELDKLGLTEGVAQFLEKLPEAAAESGDPSTISFDDLAVHSVDHGVLPTIVYPIEKIARGQQVGTGTLWIGAVLLPILLFWLGRCLERRMAARRTGE